MNNKMLVAGFDTKTGQQVSALRLNEGEALPRDHFQPGVVYGFYREQPLISEASGDVLIEGGSLMMTGSLSMTEQNMFEPPNRLEL